MSGKKDKESRRVQKNIDKITRQAHLEIEVERSRLTPLVIERYNKAIINLSIIKRFMICWKILWKNI